MNIVLRKVATVAAAFTSCVALGQQELPPQLRGGPVWNLPRNDRTPGFTYTWQGQYIYVDPATRTVVVKLSYFPPGNNSALDAETEAFMAAAAAWKP